MSNLIQSTLTDFHPSSRSSSAVRPSLLARAVATLRVWRKRSREKYALMQLSEYDLHDFGASRSDVYAELRRPFWREPSTR